MTIKRLVVFETRGERFDTLQKAIEAEENKVADFLYSCPGFYDVPLSKRLAFIAHILEHREKLRELLDYSANDIEED